MSASGGFLPRPIPLHPRMPLPFRVPQPSACLPDRWTSAGSTGFQPVKAAQPPPTAAPEGRDSVARPYVDNDGKRRVQIDWRMEEYGLG